MVRHRGRAVIVVAIGGRAARLPAGHAARRSGRGDGKLKPPSMTENSVTTKAALYPIHPQRKYAEIAPLPVKGEGPVSIRPDQGHRGGLDGAKVVKERARLPVRAVQPPG